MQVQTQPNALRPRVEIFPEAVSFCASLAGKESKNNNNNNNNQKMNILAYM